MTSPSLPQVHVAQLFVPEIRALLSERDFKGTKRLLKSISVIDLADVWGNFSSNDQSLLFPLLSGREATTLFQELEIPEQTHLLSQLGSTEIEDLLGDFNPEEAARLFHKLPVRTVERLTRYLEKEQAESVKQILTYPDNSVGSWIHLQPVELKTNLTTAQALTQIRRSVRLRGGGGPDGYYVTDKKGKVGGALSLRQLISAPTRMKLSEYMTPVRLLRLDPYQDQEDAIKLFRRYKLSMAPIVDKNDKLLGFIQAEDILPLLEEEVTEDFAKMAGTESKELETKSILQTTRLRFPWLIATCMGGFLVSLVIDHFDYILSQIIALAAFLPLIAAMGGNVGSQSSTILVRGMAIDEFHFEDRWEILFREVSVGLLLGCFYGTVIGTVSYFFFGQQFGVMFAVVVGLSMLVSMTVATAVGVIGPFTLVRFGVDPATATGPLITTITDLISTIIYFFLALWLLI